jgi:KaiC/GvpD/RAD55 family RecA-like ATPase
MTPFLPRHVKELASDVPEAPDWLVHGLLPRGTLALLAAYPKVGKSTLVGQLTVAVAQGRPFLGRPTQAGGVLVIVAEEMKDDVMRRLRHFGMEEHKDQIYLWTEGVEDTDADRKKLQNFIQDQHIALVIVDTFASYLLIPDEIDNSAVTRRLKPYVDMAHTTGATILFVHHERKNGEEGDDSARAIRGGGAILGMADLAFQLQRLSGGGSRRRLRIVGRYQEIPRSLTLDYVDDEYVSRGTPEEAGRTAQRDTVLAILPNVGLGLTVKEVATMTQSKEKAVRTALEDAFSCRSARRSGAGRRGDPFRYSRALEPTDTPVVIDQIQDQIQDREVLEV